MLRTLLRVRRRVVPAAVVAGLVFAACATSPAATSSSKIGVSHTPVLPADARIVRSVDVTLPLVSKPSSALPGANQRDVVFTDARIGFLATGGQESATDQGGVYNEVSGGIQRTIDSGKTWQTVWTAPGADISTVRFVSSTIGFAAGQVFPTSSTTSATGQPIWLRSTDGGASWSVQTPQLPTAGAGAWPALRFVTASPNLILAAPNSNENDGYLSTMLRSADGGNHWSQVGPSGWTPTGGLAFATPSLAFATGYLRDITPPAVSSKLWRSRDGGLTWSPVAGTQLRFGLDVIDFADPMHGFAAGGNLAKYEMRPSRGVVATSDGGTWRPVVRAGALSIESLSGTRGWLVATTAAGAWQSHDSGGTWTPLDQASLGPAFKLGDANLLAQPPSLLVLQQDAGLRISHDGGIHAFDVTLPGQDPNSYAPTSVAFSDGTYGVAIVGGQLCTKPPGYTGSGSGKPPTGVAQGTTLVAITGDGGTTWTARGSLDIQPVGIGAAPGFWTVAGSTNCGQSHPVVMISHDDGKHWSTQRLPAPCFAISLAAPGTIWLNCQDSLLVTRDGAASWTKYRFTQGVPWVLATGRDATWAYGPPGALWHPSDAGLTWTVAPTSF